MRAVLAHPAWTPGLLAALVIAGGLTLDSNFHLRVGALIFIFGLAAIGLNILVGFAGQVSLGHAGFLGIGAYATAIGPAHFGLPPLVAVAIGIILAGLLAFAVGRPILRLRGHYLAVATLGLGILISMLITNEAAWTGGPDGMTVEGLSVFGWRLAGARTWFWTAGTLMVIGAWLAINLLGSPTGRALRALHDSEVAAAVAGIDVARQKLVAFVVAAVYAAVAGAMFALFNRFVTPEAAGFIHSIELITMVVLGGMGSVIGAVVGAALLVLLPQFLTVFHEYETIALGLIIMLVMIFLRGGIVPSLLQRLPQGPRG